LQEANTTHQARVADSLPVFGDFKAKACISGSLRQPNGGNQGLSRHYGCVIPYYYLLCPSSSSLQKMIAYFILFLFACKLYSTTVFWGIRIARA
jgi:hypothetical protein